MAVPIKFTGGTSEHFCELKRVRPSKCRLLKSDDMYIFPKRIVLFASLSALEGGSVEPHAKNNILIINIACFFFQVRDWTLTDYKIMDLKVELHKYSLLLYCCQVIQLLRLLIPNISKCICLISHAFSTTIGCIANTFCRLHTFMVPTG